jgi:hypothetical protein
MTPKGESIMAPVVVSLKKLKCFPLQVCINLVTIGTGIISTQDA